MDLNFSPEEEAFRTEVRAFLAAGFEAVLQVDATGFHGDILKSRRGAGAGARTVQRSAKQPLQPGHQLGHQALRRQP